MIHRAVGPQTSMLDRKNNNQPKIFTTISLQTVMLFDMLLSSRNIFWKRISLHTAAYNMQLETCSLSFSNPQLLFLPHKNIEIKCSCDTFRILLISEPTYTWMCRGKRGFTPYVSTAQLADPSNLIAFQPLCDQSLSRTHHWISSSGGVWTGPRQPQSLQCGVFGNRTAQPVDKAELQITPNWIKVGSGRENCSSHKETLESETWRLPAKGLQ